MLKRVNRLKSRWEFKRALAGQRLCANPCFVLYGLRDVRSTAPMRELETPTAVMQPRFGFIVSKKVHKRAVQRNRIRRRLRELVRHCLTGEHRERFAPYRTLVFIARNGSLDASYQDLKAHLERCLKRL